MPARRSHEAARCRRRLGLAVLARPGLSQTSAGSPRQDGAAPLIGFVHGSAPLGQYQAYVAAFLDGLKEAGFEDRKNVRVEYRWAEGEYDRFPRSSPNCSPSSPQ